METPGSQSKAGAALGAERFTAVFDRHFADIYGYLRRRLTAEVAEEIAAETFLVAFRRRASFDPPAATSGPGCSGSPPS